MKFNSNNLVFEKHNIRKSLKKRYFKQSLFKYSCIFSVIFALLFLLILIGSLCKNAFPAIFYTEIKFKIESPNQTIDEILKMNFPKLANSEKNIFEIKQFLGNNLNLSNIDHKDLRIKASLDIEKSIAGKSRRRFTDTQHKFTQYLIKHNLIKKKVNWAFFSLSNSSYPEHAGIFNSFVGSILTIIICLAISVPLAILTATYLEVFAPKNKLIYLIEININNLVSVPSVIFGLIGLAVFINIFDYPRSSPLVGGLTLSLMSLPTMIVTTRYAIKAIPDAIWNAAMALGASKTQAVFHHILPLSMPGIMTGIILSISRALGETAPLLMIGMVAFIINVPTNFLEPATVLPVQIFLWFDNPEQGFIEKTAAAILILVFLISLLNLIAAFIRNKFEHRW